MWFQIARSEGFVATDAERLEVCLSDTYSTEEVDRIPRESTQLIAPGINPDVEHQSDVEDSSESSNSESDEESSAAERAKDIDDKGNQSGDEGRNGAHSAGRLNAEDLLRGQNSAGIDDGNANEAEQNPSQGMPDDTSNTVPN